MPQCCRACIAQGQGRVRSHLCQKGHRSHYKCLVVSITRNAIIFTTTISLTTNDVEALPVRGQVCVPKPDGSTVPQKESLICSGALLTGNGSIAGELSRCLGMARADFDALVRVWKHLSLSMSHKLRIFEACVVSRLMYGLHTSLLGLCEVRKLEHFRPGAYGRSLPSRIPSSVTY